MGKVDLKDHLLQSYLVEMKHMEQLASKYRSHEETQKRKLNTCPLWYSLWSAEVLLIAKCQAVSC